MNLQKENEVNERVGWLKAMRTEDAMELIAQNPLAYTLAAMIALRARWREGFNRHGLGIGEAMLGDFEKYGMTEKQYRTAKTHLEKGGFAAFRRASKGTIAKLTDMRLFSVFESREGEQKGEHEPDNGQSKGGQGATNEERRDDKNVINQERLNVAIAPVPRFTQPPSLTAHRPGEAFEKELMSGLRTLLGAREMENAGGNWRENWVRKFPGIVQRGLAELNQKITESERGGGKPIINRAAWLVDLCKRLKTEKEKRSVNLPANFTSSK
jgi:hypothetical protein